MLAIKSGIKEPGFDLAGFQGNQSYLTHETIVPFVVTQTVMWKDTNVCVCVCEIAFS